MKNLLFSVVFIFLFVVAKSQPYVSVEAGNRLGINAGYISNDNFEFKGGALFPYTRTTILSNLTYGEFGYKIGNNFNITPMLGIGHYHNTIKGIISIDKTVLVKSIEIGKNFKHGNYGNYYLFISSAYDLYVGAGLKVYIK